MTNESREEFREKVRSHNDIVGLISETVALQPRSRGEYVGLCPFHDDHNPSMRVYQDRQTFRCWACNTGGDCFTYVQERENVSFPEALEILARRAHLEVPRFVSGQSPEQESSRARLFEVLSWAEEVFHTCLMRSPAAQAARSYLSERGIDSELAKTFRLGFNPPGWDWLIKQAQGKYSSELLVDACLAVERDRGGCADFFANRITFPIHNERGQPVSFSGRILPGDDHPAKYKNGRETAVFHKSRVLYALDLAREEIKRRDHAIVVEGYTDCIALHQHGILNAVVSMGTALTDAQVTILKRFSRKVILVFDGDEAGRKAAAAAVERFLAQDVDLRILTIPDSLDPADFLASAGPQAFQQLADAAPQAWNYRFDFAREKYGITTIDGRQQVLEEMLGVLAQVPELASSVREPLLIANLAQRMSVGEATIRERLKQLRSGIKPRVRVENTGSNERRFAGPVKQILTGKLTPDDKVECDLLQNAIAVPEHLESIRNAVAQSPLRNRLFRGVLQKCFEEFDAHKTLTLSGLLDRIDDPDIQSLIVWMDEQATAKGLAEKLREGGVDKNGCPPLLRQSIDALWNREERHSHENVSIQLSQALDGQPTLDAATEALLRQAAEFHQKRATKKSGV